MKYQGQAENLFQLQIELIDTKVDLSVNKVITDVVNQIIALRNDVHQEFGGLRTEMYEMKHEMNNRFTQVEGRLSSVETALGLRNQKRNELRNRCFDYAFKAGWIVLGAAIAYLVRYFHIIFQ